MLRYVSIFSIVGLLLLFLGLRGWGQRGSAAEAVSTRRLVITGSSTMAPLISEIAKRFEAGHPGVRIDVQTGGSSRGITDVRSEAAHIGMSSRDLKESEADLHETAVGLDGIGLIVHGDNPLTDLTDQQVRGIYRGVITNWSTLGGADASIVVVNKAEGRATLELFLDHYALINSDIKAHVVIGDNEQGIKTVAGNPHAIGYVSIGAARYNASSGVPIRMLGSGGVEATLANVRSGAFPIIRRLNLITRQAPDGLARQFIEFARSPRVHDLVESFYFVPIDE